MRSSMLVASVSVVMGLAGGCDGARRAGGDDAGGSGAADAASPDASDVATQAGTSVFEARAQAIAAEYTAWGRVDDEWRWAPFLCRLPLPGVARPSASNDPTTHGQKLYSVFAKNRDAYPAGPYTAQVVVKESWTAERVDDAGASYMPDSYRPAPDAGDHFYPYAEKDGALYRAGQKAGLYIMYKVDPSTPETDEGWVYATMLPDGRVTAAGRVASCMGCHESATYERLFGVPTGAR